MQTHNNKIIFFLLFIALTALLIIKFIFKPAPTPVVVVAVQPIQNSETVSISPNISFLLSAPLKNLPLIKTSPTFPVKSSLENQNTVISILPLENLQFNTLYMVSLSSEEIVPFSLTFNTPPKPSPSPTPNPSPIVSNTTENLQNVLANLPVVTDEYTIEYFPKLKKFLILILKNPYLDNKNRVEGWFKENGIQNLSELNIEYGSVRGVSY